VGAAHLADHVLQEQQRAVVDARRAGTEAAVVAQVIALVLDIPLLLLPLHTEGRIGQHVIEAALLALLVVGMSVLGEGIAQGDVVGVLALDEHVRPTYGPGLVVPVLPVEQGVGFVVEIADVFLGHGEHAAGAAGRVVDGFHHMAAAQILFRREQEIDHQFDDLTRGEVLPGFLVGLFRADPDQLLEHIAHVQRCLIRRHLGER